MARHSLIEMRTQPLQQVHTGEQADKSPAACGEPSTRVHTAQHYRRAETRPDDEAENTLGLSLVGHLQTLSRLYFASPQAEEP